MDPGVRTVTRVLPVCTADVERPRLTPLSVRAPWQPSRVSNQWASCPPGWRPMVWSRSPGNAPQRVCRCPEGGGIGQFRAFAERSRLCPASQRTIFLSLVLLSSSANGEVAQWQQCSLIDQMWSTESRGPASNPDLTAPWASHFTSPSLTCLMNSLTPA